MKVTGTLVGPSVPTRCGIGSGHPRTPNLAVHVNSEGGRVVVSFHVSGSVLIHTEKIEGSILKDVKQYPISLAPLNPDKGEFFGLRKE